MTDNGNSSTQTKPHKPDMEPVEAERLQFHQGHLGNLAERHRARLTCWVAHTHLNIPQWVRILRQRLWEREATSGFIELHSDLVTPPIRETKLLKLNTSRLKPEQGFPKSPTRGPKCYLRSSLAYY
ncbi:hypothetical protein EYF80_012898 [Liparis tanakae]|uniref:Uncharacterized protein n=1 Tax=Liparis tanakae TaxID=230148 RepID=A0A4Z2IGN1_9TELE|nr:hypothetical protein EYF80_012898 [Liparis tanakae]